MKWKNIDGTKTTITGIEIPRTWNEEGIEYILKNEKFSGDLLLQKFKVGRIVLYNLYSTIFIAQLREDVHAAELHATECEWRYES